MKEKLISPGITDLIELIVQSELISRLVCIPAEIKSYDPAKQLCDAEPVVKVAFGDQLNQFPIFRSVPVQWPGGNGWSLVGNMAVGDIVTLTGSSSDIQDWVYAGVKNSDQAGINKFFSTFVATPGLTTQAAPMDSTKYSSAGPVLYAQSTLLLGDSSANDKVVLENLLKAAFNSWVDNIYAGHTHASFGGPPTTPAPVPNPLFHMLDDIGATKVKAI